MKILFWYTATSRYSILSRYKTNLAPFLHLILLVFFRDYISVKVFRLTWRNTETVITILFKPSVQVNDRSTDTLSISNKSIIKSFNESSEESLSKYQRFKLESEDIRNLCHLPSEKAFCIQKYISIHIFEKEFKEEISSVSIVPKCTLTSYL